MTTVYESSCSSHTLYKLEHSKRWCWITLEYGTWYNIILRHDKRPLKTLVSYNRGGGQPHFTSFGQPKKAKLG